MNVVVPFPKPAERPEALAVMLGCLAGQVLASARAGRFTEVVDAVAQMRELADRVIGNAQTPAERAMARTVVNDAALAIRQSEALIGDSLRKQRVADRNRPAYRRIQNTGVH